MRSMRGKLLFIFILIVAHQLLQSPRANAQGPSAERGFQGQWEVYEYPRSRDELPPAFKDAPLKEVPRYSLSLTIRQRGNRLSGDYGGTARYLARVEEGGRFTTVAHGNTARLRVESGFGGHATAFITLRGDRLHWKIVEEEGELYFPRETVLRRVSKRRRAR